MVYLQFGNGISKREGMTKSPEVRMLLTSHRHINQDTAVFLSLSLALCPRFSPLGTCTVGQFVVNRTTENHNVILSFPVK